MTGHPEGLVAILKPIKSTDINILYPYPYLSRASDQAIVILGFDKINEAESVLKENRVHMFGTEILQYLVSLINKIYKYTKYYKIKGDCDGTSRGNLKEKEH